MASNNKVGIKNSIATKLLKTVFSIYVIFAVGVTAGHMVIEYSYQKDNISHDLKDIQRTFEEGLGVAMWQLNQEALRTVVKGMLAVPMIVGVRIQNETGNDIVLGGVISHLGQAGKVEFQVDISQSGENEITINENNMVQYEIFKHTFPINYTYEKNTRFLGEVTIFSSSMVIYRRVKLGFLMLIVNAVLKTAALWCIFLVFATYMLRRPLANFTEATTKITLEKLASIKVKGITSDRNEIKVLEESFNSMIGNLRHSVKEREVLIQDLESKNAELERFTYTVSHDLKSPIITIKGFLGMLTSDAAEGNIDRMNDDIDRIEKAADKMQFLLDELLELSRIGRIVNPPTSVLYKDLAHTAVQSVIGRIKENDAKVEIDTTPVEIKGDISRLLEVMENLVDNAAKFSGDRETAQIVIGTRQEATETIYFVKDNGIGIKPKYHEKIFGLFDKLDQKAEGTGIGLAIVKRVIEIHKGRIWVESKGEGKGTTFCFTIDSSPADKT